MLEHLKHLKTAFMFLLLFTILTGMVYPSIVTGLAQLFFPWKANGSLLNVNGKNIGSALIGQAFSDPKLFWGRPSATTPFPYNAENSMGSNLAIASPKYISIIKTRISALSSESSNTPYLIPIDLITASASGLDPEISPAAALYQIPRISKASGIPESTLEELVFQQIHQRTFRILGEPRVNVLQLNISLLDLNKPSKVSYARFTTKS